MNPKNNHYCHNLSLAALLHTTGYVSEFNKAAAFEDEEEARHEARSLGVFNEDDIVARWVQARANALSGQPGPEPPSTPLPHAPKQGQCGRAL